jgi:arylsulfatase A
MHLRSGAAFLFLALCAAACKGLESAGNDRQSAAERPPNIILIFTDDQGYGDLSSQGHPTIRTPHIDALAAGGMKCSQFYVASPVCSPSRSALLTGCYPKRVSMHRHVVFPDYDYGLHPDEVTIADALRSAGYRTACFGKWHLGHRRGLLPQDQGFDEYFGIPYSNDMSQFHRKPDNEYGFRLPLLQGDEVVEWEPDQSLLTRRLTAAAVEFVERNADRPFFVYLPHPMPHIPIYASDDYRGRSARGRYGDVIEEIDAGIGALMAALERYWVEDDTLVIFTSDNGPWKVMQQDGGSAGPLRGGKGTNWEGGQRVPFVVHWPGKVPAGVQCTEVVTAMDVLPTLLGLCGVDLPDRVIDGHDVQDLWLGRPDARSRTECFLYYAARGPLAAIRRGSYKLWLESGELYHLEHDIAESRDIATANPRLVAELRALAAARDAEIAASARGVLHSADLVFDPCRPDR